MISSGCPLIFGEVLFDVYNETVEKLGGAPFNVARHLQGLGLKPLFISKIGSDRRGKIILSSMKNWQMSTQGVAIDQVFPTGIVSVTVKKEIPQFSILPHQAYDHIEYPKIFNGLKPKDFPLLYYGTLVTRSSLSANTLERIKNNFHGIIFVDINLRQPWWNKTTILNTCHKATWLKCNQDEFTLLKSMLPVNSEDENLSAQNLMAQFNLQSLIITRGEKGAIIYTRDGQKIIAQPKSRISMLDPVGAGDALSAVIITGILKKWDLTITLQRGVEFAAQICLIQGAIPDHSNFYTPHLEAWKLRD